MADITVARPAISNGDLNNIMTPNTDYPRPQKDSMDLGGSFGLKTALTEAQP